MIKWIQFMLMTDILTLKLYFKIKLLRVILLMLEVFKNNCTTSYFSSFTERENRKAVSSMLHQN